MGFPEHKLAGIEPEEKGLGCPWTLLSEVPTLSAGYHPNRSPWRVGGETQAHRNPCYEGKDGVVDAENPKPFSLQVLLQMSPVGVCMAFQFTHCFHVILFNYPQ